MPLALVIVAAILAIIALAESNLGNKLAWAILALALASLWGHFPW